MPSLLPRSLFPVFPDRAAALVSAAALALAFLGAGCADDPLVGPVDGASESGGSYGKLEWLPNEQPDSARAAYPDDFLKENPRRF